MTPTTLVFVLCVVVLVLAAVLLLVRITIGPTILDRSIALDVLVAIGICGLAVEAAWNRHTTTLPVLLVLTLVGFVGSVSVARFVRGSDDVEAEGSSQGDADADDTGSIGGWL